MGIISDFFVASEEELRATFPYRVAVKPEPVISTMSNPFTGETVTSKQWMPAEPFSEDWTSPGKILETELAAFRKLPNKQYGDVDQIKLASLATLLCDDDWEMYMDVLSRPALLAPEDIDSWIHRLPDTMVSKLASLQDSQVSELAVAWGDTEESDISSWPPSDVLEVIKTLCELAKLAVDSQKGFYFWIGL